MTTYVLFGGTGADFFIDSAPPIALLPGATANIYDAPTAGTQVTDLKDEAGNVVTQVTANGSGFFRFSAPDTYDVLWVDTGLGFRIATKPVVVTGGGTSDLELPGGAAAGDVVIVDGTGDNLDVGRVPESYGVKFHGDLLVASGPTDYEHVEVFTVDVPFDLKYLTARVGKSGEGANIIAKAYRRDRATQALAEAASVTLTAVTEKYDVTTVAGAGVHFAIGDQLILFPSQVGSSYVGAELEIKALPVEMTVPTPLAVPNAPTVSVASPDGSVVVVTITPPVGGGPVAGYRVYRNDVYIGSTEGATTYTDTTPGSGAVTYKARAANIDGAGSLSTGASITVGADYVWAFGGAAAAPVSNTDWPTINKGSAAPTNPFLQTGDGKMEASSGATGSFSANDKAWALSNAASTDGWPWRMTDQLYSPTTSDNGGFTLYTVADAGAGVGPVTDYMQLRQQAATARIGYRKSSGSFTTLGTYTRPVALTVGSVVAFDWHGSEKVGDVTKWTLDYYEWDPSTGSKPGTPTASFDVLKTAVPATGRRWMGVEGPSAAAASKHKIGTLLGYKS